MEKIWEGMHPHMEIDLSISCWDENEDHTSIVEGTWLLRS